MALCLPDLLQLTAHSQSRVTTASSFGATCSVQEQKENHFTYTSNRLIYEQAAFSKGCSEGGKKLLFFFFSLTTNGCTRLFNSYFLIKHNLEAEGAEEEGSSNFHTAATQIKTVFYHTVTSQNSKG